MNGNSEKYLKKNHVSLRFTFYLFYLQNEKSRDNRAIFEKSREK